MADRHDYVALEWVKGEIVETLGQARAALQAFGAEPHAGEAMGRCLGYLHQVHGSLQMVEFYGAALLAEEIEHLGRALAHGRVNQQAEAVKWLLQAFTQLPLYLDQVHLARRDLPLVVLPLINDLRSTRGALPLAETSLFAVELPTPEPLDASELARLDEPQLPESLRKWHQSLQQALVGLMREQEVPSHLGQMARVFERLETLCAGAPLSPLWQVAAGLVEGLQNGAVHNTPALRSLLKDCDRELKRLLEQGVAGFNQPAPAQLLKGLLFYVATATGQSPRLRALRVAYELDDSPAPGRTLAQEQAHLVVPDPDALRSVVSALCEELVRVKEQLDHFVRGDRQHVAELHALVPPLRQVTDTLAVLGFGQPRKVILDQMSVVLGLAQGVREPNDSVLMDVAGALLYVESTLVGMVGPDEPMRTDDSHLPGTELVHIHQLVIKEARFGLQQAKDLISEYLESGGDHERLQPLPDLLTQVRGALAMIPLPRAAGLLETCNDYIKAHLLADPQPPASPQLDALADAISAIEYYLERLSEDPQAPGERVLDVAQARLAALGYLPVAAQVPVLQDVLSPTEALAMREQQPLDSPGVTQSLAEVLASPVPGFNPPAQSAPASLLPPPAEEAAVDDELREVFMEEADEVLQVLREYLPRDDARALAEVRRGFHTLKGSGRMVRALVLSELAWACENLLNRVLEGSVEVGQEVRDLLEHVVQTLPLIIDDFASHQQRQRDDVDQLAARAHLLASAAPDDQGLDPQLLEIFRSEAQGHLATIEAFLVAAGDNQAPVDDALQRALHTLKGSASMAGVLPMAELATPLDALTREYKAHQLLMEAIDLAMLRQALDCWQQGLGQLASMPLAPLDGAAALVEQARARLAMRLAQAGERPVAKRDPRVTQTFLGQAMDILFDSESLLRRWRQQPGSRNELERLLDELTRLGEGAQLADLPEVDELCEALLDLYGAVEESSLSVSERFFEQAELAHDALIDMLDQVAAGQAVAPQPDRIRALHALLDEGLAPDAMGHVGQGGITDLATLTGQLQQQAPGVAAADDGITAFFLDEAADLLENADQALQRWLLEPDSQAALAALQGDLHTLKGGARMADIAAVDDLAQELELTYEALGKRRLGFSEDLATLLLDCHEQLATMLEQLQRGQRASDAPDLIQALAGSRQSAAPAIVEPAPAPASGGDKELLAVFLEEGLDIVESSGAALQRWQADPRNSLEVENLLRDLHTLKGGARMVEVAPIGDLAHEMEFLYENLSAGVLAPSPPLFSLLQNGHDRLAHMLDTLRRNQPVEPDPTLIAAIRGFVSPVPATPQPERAVLLPEQPVPAPERAPGDMVKVTAELLDDLGNLAGETSIFRGRIEQQVNDTQIALGEMETTIERMREQLRRLDTETQGRILSREHADNERQGYEDFDPLEMDRHSQLQQLSRALFESASDLLDLHQTLASRNHKAQALLQLQARVNTELQEGLMRTRMVPFERMVPRLQRLVRQVAGELGKQVEFDVGNAEGEMDRSVLERMLAPLEHMLRNAVDHGLEPTEVRRAKGKPDVGRITLNLLHQGGDIVIELSDDGAGVPLEAVRAKAVKRGLIEPGSEISDHDVLQFILQPGFSTAAKVTQISGRGLGMDVVHEEVKQLGGSMIIDSKPGQGARFQIRLPFSVSVNRALMVQCGEDVYALPLNGLEGIVRVMPAELEAHYQTCPPRYHYGGQTYELRYLGDLLYNTPRPKLLGQTQPLPVLLIHGHEQQMAVQVDALAGSREIVVKSLGPQFSAVQGLSGATILGDGRVVMILDLPAQIRAANVRQMQAPPVQSPLPSVDVDPGRARLVMVVDDSVTVRKVTSRLLERHGMNVLTANDGVDAMALLQEHVPDVLLLDIEMPRMDGFEVATEIRRDPRLKDLPIIMITSRTGQKHRERAMAIGVNDYLGKPYQESVLLDSIAQWSRSHA